MKLQKECSLQAKEHLRPPDTRREVCNRSSPTANCHFTRSSAGGVVGEYSQGMQIFTL